MPQFWAEYFTPQLVWLVLSFIVLYVLMARVALPRVADVLESRQDRIAGDLDQAEQMKVQAEKVLAEYEAALQRARAEAQDILSRTAAEAQAAADKRNGEVAERLQQEANAAAARIADAKAAALEDLRGVAADLARAAAERLIGGEVPQADVQQAVDSALRRSG